MAGGSYTPMLPLVAQRPLLGHGCHGLLTDGAWVSASWVGGVRYSRGYERLKRLFGVWMSKVRHMVPVISCPIPSP